MEIQDETFKSTRSLACMLGQASAQWYGKGEREGMCDRVQTYGGAIT